MAAAWRDGICNAAALPALCWQEPGIGDLAARLLDLSCKYCPLPNFTDGSDDARPAQSKPCSLGDEMADDALYVLMRPGLRALCPLVVMVSALVTLQVSASTRPVETGSLEDIVTELSLPPYVQDNSFDLYPFPLWSDMRSLLDQIKFHARFQCLHLHSCRTDRQEEQRGKFAIRAGHDKPETYCIARPTDFHIVQRCRHQVEKQINQSAAAASLLVADGNAKKVGTATPLSWLRSEPEVPLDAIACPSEEARAAWAAERLEAARASPQALADEEAIVAAHRKYAARSGMGSSEKYGLGCDDPAAEWRYDLTAFHKCILVVVCERLRLAPGSKVLDWGTGCGHKLSWATQLYGIEGFGIDIVYDSVRWAQEHSAGRYCEVDGRFISWLPDNYFDAIISYAALAHLTKGDQCRVMTDLLGKLRIGGRLWFGWNAPEIFVNNTELETTRWMLPADDAWADCFRSAMETDLRWSWRFVLRTSILPGGNGRVQRMAVHDGHLASCLR
eukprot:TRINITY_DN70253_c0_g1_i2.p1 TRINITY_DN70253_c0_g1~~TRINITY_DN70253_c0_g1_i2.p1  ORF type:complete len:503 (+),score=95.97 TRINITY_DN70253_c0_g1_i2:36-1544(+)